MPVLFYLAFLDLSFTHFLANNLNLFSFVAEKNSTVYALYTFSISFHPSLEEYLSYFNSLAIVNSTAISMSMHLSLYSSMMFLIL